MALPPDARESILNWLTNRDLGRTGELGIRGTIIAVDDDADLRRFYKTALQAAGFNVFTADDGDACLALLNRITPALLILDIDMPRVTGFETLENVRRYHPHIRCPVIFSTIHQTSDSVRRAKALGATSFLIKPVDAETLVERVGVCLRRKSAGYPMAGEL